MVVRRLENSRKNTYVAGMDIFSMLFALVMIAAAIAATLFVGIYAGGIWGALGFAALIWALYKMATHQSGPDRPLRSDTLNAFQAPLSDD